VIFTGVRAHVPAQILKRPEPFRTQRAEDFSLGVVRLKTDVDLDTIADSPNGGWNSSRTGTCKRLLHQLVDEVCEVPEVGADAVLVSKQDPVGRVGGRLVLEAREARVEGRVAQVALESEVDAVLLEVAKQRLAAVERARALPAFGDSVHVVVVALRVDLGSKRLRTPRARRLHRSRFYHRRHQRSRTGLHHSSHRCRYGRLGNCLFQIVVINAVFIILIFRLVCLQRSA